ncbi:MAG TPA: DinB family protein, partial [Chitinophagaceae bacterium]|nr:DinB family protein [Chitinophagaceae bacterium]
VGNIILHLCGNMRQYAISSLGNSKDVRERDKEFSADGGYSGAELFKKLTDTVEQAKKIIQSTTEEELLRERKVQGYTHSGIGIVLHVTEHYSYHTGQIIFWTKLLKDKDLGFYAGVDLNTKNEN